MFLELNQMKLQNQYKNYEGTKYFIYLIIKKSSDLAQIY